MYYNKKYFDWQKNLGRFGGIANLKKFSKFIKPTDNVVDFGCGGGYLLKNLKCKHRAGVEINPIARKTASDNGIKVCKFSKDLIDSWADVIISDNALEHTQDPLGEVKALFPKLKKGGLIIFVVPCESYKMSYNPDDINKHLFSWSPVDLGNLFTLAGYKVISVKLFLDKWPPYYATIAKIFGVNIFNIISSVYGHINRKWVQIQIVATRK